MTKNHIYNRHFHDLRGLDLSTASSEISRYRFADMENMWRDPVAFDSALTETFPGYRLFAKLPSPIHGIYGQRAQGKSYIVVHAGKTLYRFESALCNHPEDMAAQTPLAEDLPAERGCAFSSGDALCLLIGGTYYRLSADGELSTLNENPDLAYIPATFYNTEPYEQRNLLTDKVRHIFTADGDYAVKGQEKEGLHYTVYDNESKTCYVTATAALKGTAHIEIPENCVIDGEEYTVIGIGNSGFCECGSLISIHLPETLDFIGPEAFMGCASLMSIRLPDSLKSMGSRVFYGCTALEKVHFGKNFSSFREETFSYCLSLSEASFAFSSEAYIDMCNKNGPLFENTISLFFDALPPVEYDAVLFRYPLMEKALSLSDVILGDRKIGHNFTETDDGYVLYRTVSDGTFITHIELLATKESLLENKELCLSLSLSPSHFATPKGYAAFGNAHPEIGAQKAVCGCRMAAAYDGRIFLSGNPALPNTVFHTLPDDSGRNNPFYIGALSYFNDGTSSVPNRALLAAGNTLIVFKSDTDGEGAIFYHTAESTGISLIPRIYPVTAGMTGIGATGCAVNFKDDPVFLGRDGLLGIEKQSLNLERSIKHRSLSVNSKLLKEDLSSAVMVVHEGMLYLLAGGNIYLADSRRYITHSDGTVGYEWYFLSHIGSFEGDRPLYRTTAFLPEGSELYGITVAPHEGTEAIGTVYSLTLPSGTKLYYEKKESGEKYAVDCDGERTGGVFSAACALCVAGERLFFGTCDGSLGVFNTDKRGMKLCKLTKSPLYVKKDGRFFASSERALSHVSKDVLERLPLFEKNGDVYTEKGEADVYLDGGIFSIAEPLGEKVTPSEIHRYFYTYGGHAYTAACSLAPDDGEFPHYTKDTLPRTAAAKVKAYKGGALSVLVRTDRTPWHVCETVSSGCADFGDFDFSLLDFHNEEGITLPLREKEKRWCFKQYRFASSGIRRPFGLYALSYSYRLSGTLKN